ncbi:hypothetical protein Poly51_47430 [Rubripirellula tenax]|uniref:Transmembrane protein n=1 Tax=Rubripirellula tenax TaxID=2528015 RepID=A0A5C6ENC0_9BACT|nr:hypothetical protein [Rubripirellula tenax]TWU48839.1 hypothetical protein Poly51_47430 [Rubripirellula tenax]
MNDADFSRSQSAMYQYSGRVPAGGLLLGLAILVPASILLGVLYSGIVVYLPFLKLRCIVTLAYGGLLGVLVGRTCRFTKFRSHFAVAAMTLVITVISFYSAWAVHCAWFIQSVDGFGKEVIEAAILGFDPRVMLGWGTYIFENGLWFKNGNPHDGWEAVTGWVIEAAIVFVTAWLARRSYGNSPFCETCDRWTEETKELAALPVSPVDPAWQTIATGNIAAFRRLQFAQQSSAYVELQLASCPDCSESDFLSAVAVKMVLNNEGKIEKKETDLFRSMPITAEQKAEVIDFSEQMAEAQRIMAEEADAAEETASPNGDDLGESTGVSP